MFADRTDAGRQLGRRLLSLGGLSDGVVLGLPRGGVPVAAEVALLLGLPLDVIVVRKLGAPAQPELAVGAVGEGRVRVLNHDVIAAVGMSDTALQQASEREWSEVDRRAQQYRRVCPRVPLEGRPVVLVDDGLATGATARAACQVAAAHGAGRVVLAVPVAPAGWRRRFVDVAAECVCLEEPPDFGAVGGHYVDFKATPDSEVLEILAAGSGI